MKYWAFLSYSHTDRKWGDWLHKALETYRVPRHLIGKESRDGTVPARLFPIFRDREELPVSADLGANINEALRESRYLIVICSPRAAQSRWVGEEIKTFKKLGREDRILALVIDGEPNASDGKPGFVSADECFPEPMRYRLDADGQFSPERTEPVAADARKGKDGKNNAKLKLLAGLVGVNYDDLKQREQERRIRRLRVVLVVTLALVSGFAVLSMYAWRLKQVAQQQELSTRSRLSDNYLDRALVLLAATDSRQGCANLVAALQANPDNTLAADRLLFELNYRDWLIPTFVLPLPEEIRAPSDAYEETEALRARLLPDGTAVEVLTLDFNGQPARVFRSGLARTEWRVVESRRKSLVPDSDTATRQNQFRMISVSQDFRPVMADNSRELNRAKRFFPDLSLGSLFLSTNSKWAAVILHDESRAGEAPIEFLDWQNGRRLKMRGELMEVEQLTGLPAFHPKRPVAWLFRPRGRYSRTRNSAVLQSVDLYAGRVGSEESFPPVFGLEALAPKFTPDGTHLVVSHEVRNRVGEVLDLFELPQAGEQSALKLIAAELQLPGGLGEVTSDARFIVAISPTSVVGYRRSDRAALEGAAASGSDQLIIPSHPGGMIEAMSPDGTLKATGAETGHFVVTDRKSGTVIATFESEYEIGEGGRGIIHAEFTPDSQWLLVWGYSIGGGWRDTEVYEPRSGRLMFPRFNEAPRITAHSWNMIRKASDDRRGVVLLNNQTVLISPTRERMPEEFAELAEAIIGAYIDKQGVYHISDSPGSRAIRSAKDIREIMARLDSTSAWTKFVKDRFSGSLSPISGKDVTKTPSPDQSDAAPPTEWTTDAMEGERFPETRLRLVSPEEVKEWSIDGLQYAINEIYARRGAAFPNHTIQESFAQFSWFHPQENNKAEEIEGTFTDTERRNVQMLSEMRNKAKNERSDQP